MNGPETREASAQINRASTLLELRDVHAFYGHIHALKGVSLEVREGEIVTLIGSNGAGKSTCLRCISGLVHPKSGSIRFKGAEIQSLKPHAIAALGIGHSPEGRRIFPKLTVEENLDLGAYLERDKSVIARRKSEVFELFPRLAERRRQEGGTLSGGEQQMLAIGRALMQDPALLLLDEPTLGLAPVLVESLFETLQTLHRVGKTILLVEQNAWHALRLAERAYVLQTGRITHAGPASELARDPDVRRAYLGGP
ncbi:MAG: ABC transporter ATP-binding protein [Kiritimatiellae bacterium]|nr:ABC transporter ATP-binding protein [Kiritimatiellia bacterium]MDW8459329.1 ABC transporter ATP-binding protein [Verrucomicrobiota bacterium]